MIHRDQILALAAVLSCCILVQRLARSGGTDENALGRLVSSALELGNVAPEQLYGGAANLAPGLRMLAGVTGGRPSAEDLDVLRMAAAVLKVQKRLRRAEASANELGRRLAALAEKPRPTPLPESFYFTINDLYTDTISGLGPRIVVNGSEGHLQSALVVAKVRSALLAAIRGAYLWHELGGRQWHVLVFRKRLGALARDILAGRETGTG